MAYNCTLTVEAGKVASEQTDFCWLFTEQNFVDANNEDAINGSANSILNGGGNLRCYTDDTKAVRLPVEVVTFITGISPVVIVWGLSPLLNVGSTVYVEADTSENVQPPVNDTYGRNSVWFDYELVIHQGTIIDSTGNHTPVLNGTPALTNILWGQGYNMIAVADYISVAHTASLNVERNYTIQMWSDTVLADITPAALFMKSPSNFDSFRWFKHNGGDTRQRSGNLSPANLNSVDGYGLRRDTAIFNGTTRSSLLDSGMMSSDTPTGTVVNNTDEVRIAGVGDPVSYGSVGNWVLNGALGETWYQKQAITMDRDAGERNNQLDPGSFWSTSAWEDSGGGGEVTIPVSYRGTANHTAEYLRALNTYLAFSVNEIIIEWLKGEGVQGETYNELFYNYWVGLGYTGTYTDMQYQWQTDGGGGQLVNAIYNNDVVPGGFIIPGDWPTINGDRLPETSTPW